MLSDIAIIEECVRLQRVGHTLDGILAYPNRLTDGAALIAGPHPLLGGDMRNNVVNSLLKALVSQGCVTLTFDYSGVGDSGGGPADWPAVMSKFWKTGTFVEENDWTDDTRCAMDSLRQWCDMTPVLLGYSFGCWTISKNLRESCAKAIVLISPNPKQHDFEQLSLCQAPLLVIHSDNDFTCDASEMKAWFDSIREPKTRIQWPTGEHFFRGQEMEVTMTVLDFLQQHHALGAEPHVNGY